MKAYFKKRQSVQKVNKVVKNNNKSINKIDVASWWKVKDSVCNACECHHVWKFECQP